MLLAMSRNAIEHTLRLFENAYRGDRFHALLVNLQDLLPGEWDLQPGNHSAEVFGDYPELSICDLVLHVAGAMRVWSSQAFGDRSLTWGMGGPASRDLETVLAYLEGSHEELRAKIEQLADDSALDGEVTAPGGRLVPAWWAIATMNNHMLYHSGEINRQRTLYRGATGWTAG